ncbi:MAG: ATP cone domain-containing protein, partial [Deltaproteobacteria bacterium]|nr:ATP cone domain-containing protein [Deltaproteobacteria bacterium]
MPQSSAVVSEVLFASIKKRDQRLVPFEAAKISSAILKAGRASGQFEEPEARRLMVRVLTLAQNLFGPEPPTVEDVQDLVEEVLLSSPHKKA